MYSLLFITFLLALYLYFTQQYIKNSSRGKFYWTVSFVFLFILRFKYILIGSINPDEDQWLISANSMIFSFKDWSTHFAPYDMSRLYTILPLVILSPVLNMTSISSAHILAILFSSIFIYFSFQINKLLLSHYSAVATSSLLILVFGLARQTDMLAYNSEYPAVTLLTVATYLLVLFGTQKEHKSIVISFLIGFVISLVPFAKEQAVIIALLLVIISLFQIALSKSWKNLLAWAIGGISGVLLSLSPLILTGKLRDFIFQIQIIQNYCKVGLDLSHNTEKVNLHYNVMKMLTAYWFQNDSFLIFILVFIGFVFCLVWLVRNLTNTLEIGINYVYFIAIILLTIYTVYLPGNNFYHYIILFYLPSAFCIGFLFWLLYSNSSKLIGNIILVFLFGTQFVIGHISFVKNINAAVTKQISDVPVPSNKSGNDSLTIGKKYDRVDELLATYSKQGDLSIFWGWDNALFVKYKLKRCSRYLYPQFAMNGYSQSNRVKQIYMDDILYFKPKIILELVGKDRFYFTSPEYEIRNVFPQLQQYLSQNYVLVEAGDNFKFYLKK